MRIWFIPTFMACSPCSFRISWNLSIGVKLLLLISFIFFELDICGLSSRYFISCLPFCPVPDCARLCEKIPEHSGEDDFFSKPRRGPALHNPAGTGRPLQAEIKQRSPLSSIHRHCFPLPLAAG